LYKHSLNTKYNAYICINKEAIKQPFEKQNKMKVKETRFAEEIKFDSKKEIREYLENAKNGQWLLSYSLYPNGIENIGKTSDGQYCNFAHGVNWTDQDISIMTLKGAVDNLWKENGKIQYSEREGGI